MLCLGTRYVLQKHSETQTETRAVLMVHTFMVFQVGLSFTSNMSAHDSPLQIPRRSSISILHIYFVCVFWPLLGPVRTRSDTQIKFSWLSGTQCTICYLSAVLDTTCATEQYVCPSQLENAGLRILCSWKAQCASKTTDL